MKKLAALLMFGGGLGLSAPLSANDIPTRWFEVEVILFTHNTEEAQLKEEFIPEVKPIRYRRTRDLLSGYHFPDISNLIKPNYLCSFEQLVPAPSIEDIFYPDGQALSLINQFDESSTDIQQTDGSSNRNSDEFSQEYAGETGISAQSGSVQSINVADELPADQQTQDTAYQSSDYQSFGFESVVPEPMPPLESFLAPYKPEPELVNVEALAESLQNPLFGSPYGPFFTDRPDCLSSPLPQIPLIDNQDLAFQYDMFPRVVVAGERDHNPYVHLLSPANFKLREIYRSMRRSADMRPILHTGWREAAGAERISRATRLYAGIDFSDKFDFQGNPLPPETFEWLNSDTPEQPENFVETNQQETPSVVDNIERLLAMVDNGATINYQSGTIETPEKETNTVNIKEVREIDGLFRIYVDQFNYLHIDAEFNVRKEVPAPIAQADNSIDALLAKLGSQEQQSSGLTIEDGSAGTVLRNYHFKQTRRVITKQVHYFDHPFMGLIVQIRRYGW